MQHDVRRLISDLNDHLAPLSPPEFEFQLTVDEMAEPNTTVLIARDANHTAVGCGALKVHNATLGEVKRMFAVPESRGTGVGSRILDTIIAMARERSLQWLMLETGVGPAFDDAWRLYKSRGFTQRGPFLEYPDSEWNAYFELHLGGDSTRR